MEKIIKEGKELETILNEIIREENIKLEELYYKYKTKKSGLFGKSSIVVEAVTRNNLIEFIKDYLKELTNNLGIKVFVAFAL